VPFDRFGTVRTFIAIDVDRPSESTAGPWGGGRPSHVTLRFLGEVAAVRIEPIATTLRGVAAMTAPFDLTLEGVGAFPSRAVPRVVWIGATSGSERVIRLAARISDALHALGFPREPRGVVPHLTWFRVRSGRDRHRARALLDGSDPPPPARTVRVTEIALKESILTPSGADYRTWERFPLSGRDGTNDSPVPPAARSAVSRLQR